MSLKTENPLAQHQAQIEKKRYGAGDTYLVRDVLPPDELEGAFERLCEEVEWNTMNHRGGEVPRLVAVQGTVDADGTIPIYRHPADSSPPLLPFTPTVALILQHVSQYLPASHPGPLNHVLIQRYRTGEDYISEHADKTVDVVRGSCIVNVSLGTQRRMTLRTKKNHMNGRSSHTPSPSSPSRSSPSSPTSPPNPDPTSRIYTKQHVPLLHNSAFIMGLTTNQHWLHSIRADKRPLSFLSPAELAFGRERISLTFRCIGTFLSPAPAPAPAPAPPISARNINPDSKSNSQKWLIWGQGARSKSRRSAFPISSDRKERAALIRAFGEENHFSDFVWERAYGRGFDVLDFTGA